MISQKRTIGPARTSRTATLSIQRICDVDLKEDGYDLNEADPSPKRLFVESMESIKQPRYKGRQRIDGKRAFLKSSSKFPRQTL
jgi:hypothetical protein